MAHWLINLRALWGGRSHKQRMKIALQEPTPERFDAVLSPTNFGHYDAGLRVMSGAFLRDFQIDPEAYSSIWDAHANSKKMYVYLHRFDWADDLSAVNTVNAVRLMQDYCHSWITRYGGGEGMGWEPFDVAWRLLRMSAHGLRMLQIDDIVAQERYLHMIAAQKKYLELSEGEDLSQNLIMSVAILVASWALGDEDASKQSALNLHEDIEAFTELQNIYLASRDSSELVRLLLLLNWTRDMYMGQSLQVSREHLRLIEQLGQAVRALRFNNGELLQVHTALEIPKELVAQAVASAQLGPPATEETVLGFSALRSGPVTVFLDTDSPPICQDNPASHASTLAIWMSDRHRIIIGSKGSAGQMPFATRLAVQSSQAHSTLIIDEASSSLVEPPNVEQFENCYAGDINEPAQVGHITFKTLGEADEVEQFHTGYQSQFGLVHERKVSLDRDGCYFAGIDILRPHNEQGKSKIEALLRKQYSQGLPFSIYFHLHEDIDPILNTDEQSIMFYSAPNARWMFRQQGARIAIIDNVLYRSGQSGEISSRSLMLESRLMEPSGYVSWSFQLFQEV